MLRLGLGAGKPNASARHTEPGGAKRDLARQS